MANKSKILVFAPEISSRIEFVFEFILQSVLGVEVEFTTKESVFLQSDLPKINYSQNNLSSGLFLKAHRILFEKNLVEQQLDEIEYEELRLFFRSSADSLLPFDPFACAFYLLTRYEEYLAENTDEHERFADSENILYRLGMSRKPVVDQMAIWIGEKIVEKYPEVIISRRQFQFVTTIDIDNAWAFKNKSFLIWLGAAFKSIFKGQWNDLKMRLVVSLGLRKDPYDTYKYILETYKGLLNHILFFFLMGDRNHYDKNISHKNKVFRQLIVNLASVCEVGIHPSYASNQKLWIFEKEKERLEEIIQQPVTKSRQHFLRLSLPKTYQNLLKSGISDDYTMGFASLVGFRAGTCTAFPFFDLSKNKRTELTVHPFQVMDVSLKNYLHLGSEEAWQTIEELMTEVKKVGGTFISLWHNESLKDSGQWLGWRRVFEQVRETGLKHRNE